ncbi:MAG: hypothetical protein GZ093_06205, partial [Rhodoferax sp.]|uniref:hypothetical protein n=1 Tax=Rhodoferax sp. TaxID=50421 RepID=UPI0013FE991A
MNTRTFICSLLLVTFVSGIGAQSLPRDSEPMSSRPLNLSVRKPIAPAADPTVLLVDKEGQVTSPVQPGGASSQEDTGAAVVMPYGAGYENRQQGKASGNSGGGGSSGGGSSGGGSSGGGSSGGGSSGGG